uniref:Uncharacterized protein n=1 Tax=Arundo donax TaxID=35708 RepID=A0A0A9G5C6_ARUDO
MSMLFTLSQHGFENLYFVPLLAVICYVLLLFQHTLMNLFLLSLIYCRVLCWSRFPFVVLSWQT